MRHILRDEEWDQLQPLLPSEVSRRGRPWVPHRQVIDGILWVLATAVPWRDLPDSFGKWKTVYNRFRRWCREGVWDELLEHLYRLRDAQGQIDRSQWNVDGSVIRAHRCASGSTSTHPLESANHGLGYSQGGYSTKLHVVADGWGTVLNVIATGGQTHETTQFEKALTTVPLASGKLKHWPDRVAGDKGYSSSANRQWLKRRRIEDVIASKSNEAGNLNFDKQAYKARNIVERAIGHLKEKRRIATRYEKNEFHYLAMVKAAIIRQLLNLDLRDSA